MLPTKRERAGVGVSRRIIISVVDVLLIPVSHAAHGVSRAIPVPTRHVAAPCGLAVRTGLRQGAGCCAQFFSSAREAHDATHSAVAGAAVQTHAVVTRLVVVPDCHTALPVGFAQSLVVRKEQMGH